MRKFLRGAWKAVLGMLVLAGVVQLWTVGSWAVGLWRAGGSLAPPECSDPAAIVSASPSSAMTVVILSAQPDWPAKDLLVDKDYPMNTALLINAGRGVLKVQGRLKSGEVSRQGKFLVYCEPGKTARLCVPVRTDSIAEGWRPIELVGTECVFTLPRTQSASGSLIAKQ